MLGEGFWHGRHVSLKETAFQQINRQRPACQMSAPSRQVGVYGRRLLEQGPNAEAPAVAPGLLSDRSGAPRQAITGVRFRSRVWVERRGAVCFDVVFFSVGFLLGFGGFQFR